MLILKVPSSLEISLELSEDQIILLQSDDIVLSRALPQNPYCQMNRYNGSLKHELLCGHCQYNYYLKMVCRKELKGNVFVLSAANF